MKVPGFIDWDAVPPFQLSPGVRLRTPHGEHIMLSMVELDAGAIVPTHQHPHEQAGIVLSGRMKFTIGDETRLCLPGESYIVPPNAPHRAEAIDGPVRALDIFSPVREDYAALTNQYVDQ